MQDSKLFTLLQALDAAEFKRLRKFLQSPFYNSNKNVVRLYEYLADFYPKFEAKGLKMEAAFQRLFAGQPFDLNKMRKLMSALCKLTEAYLAALAFEQSGTQKKKLLASAYRQRHLDAFFEKEMLGILDELNAQNANDSTSQIELLQLNLELFFRPGLAAKETSRRYLEAAMEHLDIHFVLTKLQLAAEMRTRENILAEEHNIKMLEAVIREAKHPVGREKPLCQVYSHILDLHQDAGEASLPHTIAIFEKIIPDINLMEQQIVLHHLLNHCVRLLNSGESHYRQDIFYLYKLGLKHNLLLENDQITEITFSNIVAVSSSLKEFEWAQGFVHKFSAFLNEDSREDIKALSAALLYFNQQAYNQAEQALLGYQFSDTLNLLKSRCLLIKIYFEQFLLDKSKYTFLMDQAEAFEKFVRRHTALAKGKRGAYLNFIKLTKKLASKTINKVDLAKTRAQFYQLEGVTHKGWLLEKIGQ